MALAERRAPVFWRRYEWGCRLLEAVHAEPRGRVGLVAAKTAVHKLIFLCGKDPRPPVAGGDALFDGAIDLSAHILVTRGESPLGEQLCALQIHCIDQG